MKKYKQQLQEEWLLANPYLVEQWRQRGLEPERNYHFDRYRGSHQEPAFVEGLLASLEAAPTRRTLGEYIALLARTKYHFSAEHLIPFFLPEDTWLGFDVIYALGRSRGSGRQQWFAAVIEDPAMGRLRKWAVSYTKFFPQGRLLLPLIRKHFREFPYEALDVFDHMGGPEELQLLNDIDWSTVSLPSSLSSRKLQELLASARTRIERRLRKAARRREKRLRRKARRSAAVQDGPT